MALKFNRINFMKVLKTEFAGGDGQAAQHWRVAILDGSDNIIESAVVQDLMFSTVGENVSFVLPQNPLQLTIPSDTTVAKIRLQRTLDTGSTWATIAEDTVSNGYYEYGGIFEITWLVVEFLFTVIV